jgi:hypothetical protein
MIAERAALAVEDGEPAITLGPVPRGRLAGHEWEPLKATWMPHGDLRVASRPPRLQPGRALPFLTAIPYQAYLGFRSELLKPLVFFSEDDGTRTRNHRIDSLVIAFSTACIDNASKAWRLLSEERGCHYLIPLYCRNN